MLTHNNRTHNLPSFHLYILCIYIFYFVAHFSEMELEFDRSVLLKGQIETGVGTE